MTTRRESRAAEQAYYHLSGSTPAGPNVELGSLLPSFTLSSLCPNSSFLLTSTLAPSTLLFSHSSLNDMLMRFEEPNAMTRWDSPLFVLTTELFGVGEDQGNGVAASAVDGSSAFDGLIKWEDPPYDELWEAVAQGKVSKAPNVVSQVSGRERERVREVNK